MGAGARGAAWLLAAASCPGIMEEDRRARLQQKLALRRLDSAYTELLQRAGVVVPAAAAAAAAAADDGDGTGVAQQDQSNWWDTRPTRWGYDVAGEAPFGAVAVDTAAAAAALASGAAAGPPPVGSTGLETMSPDQVRGMLEELGLRRCCGSCEFSPPRGEHSDERVWDPVLSCGPAVSWRRLVHLAILAYPTGLIPRPTRLDAVLDCWRLLVRSELGEFYLAPYDWKARVLATWGVPAMNGADLKRALSRQIKMAQQQQDAAAAAAAAEQPRHHQGGGSGIESHRRSAARRVGAEVGSDEDEDGEDGEDDEDDEEACRDTEALLQDVLETAGVNVPRLVQRAAFLDQCFSSPHDGADAGAGTGHDGTTVGERAAAATLLRRQQRQRKSAAIEASVRLTAAAQSLLGSGGGGSEEVADLSLVAEATKRAAVSPVAVSPRFLNGGGPGGEGRGGVGLICGGAAMAGEQLAAGHLARG
eukprot:COSAG01_NODE_4528_length_4950_cov_21.526902_6_plen_475_part_01